jgi:prepilin-type processing-associated H-X9-DG protein
MGLVCEYLLDAYTDGHNRGYNQGFLDGSKKQRIK